MNFFTFYVIVINILTFSFCLYDKICAIRKRWRVSEKFLMLLSVMGGSIGMLLGMFIAHHKTKKPKFLLGIPTILFVQFLLVSIISQKN